MNERRSKKKRIESLRLRKTGVKDKHLYGGCVCCLSLPSLSRASATSTRRQNKRKEKKKKRKLYPPFPVQNQTCSRGTWKEAKMWHSHPYRISRFIIFSLFFSLSWLSWQPPNRLLFSISSSGGARTRWVREVERHVTVSNTL